AGDRAAGAAIIDENAARRLWPGESPINRVLKLGDSRSSRPWIRVVGVVRPFRLHMTSDPDMLPEPAVYVIQNPEGRYGEMLVNSATPAKTATNLRRMIYRTFPLKWMRLNTWDDLFGSMVASRYLLAWLFATFAGFTLLLALAGLYGPLSYGVSRRLKELAVRGALGASPVALRKLIWTQMLVAILAGTALGGPAGMWAGQALDGALFGLFYVDVTVLVIAEAILVGTALLACVGPARRAGRVNVSAVLKEL
ncbi:MAG: FtsX-like permease family protein, partial [Gemmatimonadaceae bacterium]